MEPDTDFFAVANFPQELPHTLAVPPQAQVSFNFLGNESHESIGESLFHLRSTALVRSRHLKTTGRT